MEGASVMSEPECMGLAILKAAEEASGAVSSTRAFDSSSSERVLFPKCIFKN